MKIFATTAIERIEPGVSTHLPLFKTLARRDRFGMHRLVNDTEEADIILFLDGHQHYRDLKMRAIRRHPLTREYPGKTFVYSEQDQPWCAMQGLYVGMPKRSFDWRLQRPCSYLSLVNPFVGESRAPEAEPDLLFSYMGRRCHPIRDALLGLSHPRALVEDTTRMSFFGAEDEAVLKQKKRYAETLKRSKFVLCPRGGGPASFRLFETMASGRAPVILSDEWTPPTGPRWERFSLRLPEAKVKDIPSLLEEREADWAEMGNLAREEWEEWFAPDVLFHRMVEGCREIMESRQTANAARPAIFNGRFLYLMARSMKSRVRSRISAEAGS